MKKENYLKNRHWLLAVGFFMSGTLQALTPVWTYSAPFPASVSITDGETATIAYTVTNQSQRSKSLILKATPGLNASACYLESKGSTCALTLTVDGSLIPNKGLHTGPILCELGNSHQCYQPSRANSLQINKTPVPPMSYTIGGTILGLFGSISLQNNGYEMLTQNNDGTFTFATPVAQGDAYNVTVSSQPAVQTCTVNNGTGIMGASNVTNVQVTCSTNRFTVGGTVSGLVGLLSLQNNGGDTLTRNNDGTFTFATPLAQGDTYNVTVSSQPPTQTCTVNNGVGTMGGSNVTNVEITCSVNSFTVGGTVSGLVGSISLQNSVDTLVINADGSFTFPTVVAQGASYNVTVSSQPATQTCTVNNGTGTMGGGNVTNVEVICSVNSFTVGGTLSGLIGSISLQNNDSDTLTLNTDGSFTFETPVAQGASYNITVSSHPAGQACTVTNDTGIMGGAPVTNIQVSCSSNTTTLSISATGVIPVNAGSGTITVTNTGVASTAANVSVTLPSGWTAVTQDSSTCTSIPPGGFCTISFTSTLPYIATGNIPVIGNNISNTPTTALAFSVNGYLVWEVVNATTVQVIDSVDLAPAYPNGVPWKSTNVPVPGAISPTNGAANTLAIVALPETSAALLCNQSTNGGASTGTWYLPAICQMGITNSAGPGCSVGFANIDTNLVQLGFGNLGNPSTVMAYWSSSQNASLIARAWSRDFLVGGGGAFSNNYNINVGVRCARTLSY